MAYSLMRSQQVILLLRSLHLFSFQLELTKAYLVISSAMTNILASREQIVAVVVMLVSEDDSLINVDVTLFKNN